MSRNARQKSESGIYHIIVRGVNRQGCTQRQIARVTGLDSNIAFRA